ncbi:MAG: helix-turn-helix transcriptional regulator [Gammaproteobacteria bacterium]|nr:helix-turn-helix transcriptional regulator [Gammaproteobacteria bacterium]
MLEHALETGRIGVCVKDRDRRVLTQNASCREICGDRQGEICEDGCMRLHEADAGRQWQDRGCSAYRNSAMHGGSYDVALVCSAERIITFLQPLEDVYASAIAHYADKGLTRREHEIVGLLIRGRSNAELCAGLGITRATLRTHLNRIYAKLRDSGAAVDFLPRHRLALTRPGGPASVGPASVGPASAGHPSG